MSSFLRFLSVVIGAAGVVGGLLLIAQAQPSESYGEVNAFLAGYGIAAAVSGLFWGVLGMAVSKVLERIEGQEEGTPATTSEASAESTEHESGLQDVETSGGLIFALLLAAVVILLVVIALASSA